MSEIIDILLNNEQSFTSYIKRICIINEKKEMIYCYNNPNFNNDRDESLLSHFILAMNSFAREFGEDKLSSIDLGKEKIYSLAEKSSPYLFVVVCDKNVRISKGSLKLSKIKRFLKENYTKNSDNLNSNEDGKDGDLFHILHQSTQNYDTVERFLGDL